LAESRACFAAALMLAVSVDPADAVVAPAEEFALLFAIEIVVNATGEAMDVMFIWILDDLPTH
jgi:hypothetical protein